MKAKKIKTNREKQSRASVSVFFWKLVAIKFGDTIKLLLSILCCFKAIENQNLFEMPYYLCNRTRIECEEGWKKNWTIIIINHDAKNGCCNSIHFTVINQERERKRRSPSHFLFHWWKIKRLKMREQMFICQIKSIRAFHIKHKYLHGIFSTVNSEHWTPIEHNE